MGKIRHNVRLPAHFKPERYKLRLTPDIENASFYGEEVIEYVLRKSTNRIVLHAAEIIIEEAEVLIGKHSHEPVRISFDEKKETVTFIFKKPLPRGRGQLHIAFRGILNDRMHGFYRSSYLHEGKKRWLATTQFEAVDARRAFPCVDEPAAKAVFEVTMVVPQELAVISNTIESSVIEHQGGYKAVNFVESPKMSTYLLAFIVGDFEYVEGKSKRGVKVRVFVTPGKKRQADFALDTAIRCLDFYEQYFDIPYPLPVLDLIAIPDFSNGGMENWGAITYRETALLFDPDHSSAANKQRVAIVIAHELAHQWFGNLVTMEWWTHLWLNEGFASYMEYLATDHLFPDWDIWTQFGNDDLGRALSLDALKHTHAIEIPVHHPAEIDGIFDAVSYSKGASVIRMLAAYIGDTNFRDGLRLYLKKHSYRNASTIHLWQAFERASKKPVRAFMKNWTGKPGYPLVKVHDNGKSLGLSQSRFFSSPISKRQAKDTTSWNIPIGIMSRGKKPSMAAMMSAKTGKIARPKGWVKLNPGETGFYRVDYPPSMIMDQKSAVENGELGALDRLALIRDAFALARAGESATTDALNLITAYRYEKDYTVWIEILSGIASIQKLVYGTKAYPRYQRFAIGILEPIATHLGFEPKRGESHTRTLLRSMILAQLIMLDHEPSIRRGLTMFRQKHIPADLRNVAYRAATKRGDAKLHEELTKRYIAETLQQERDRIAAALGSFEDAKLLQKSLEFSISEHVRPQDSYGIITAVWRNQAGTALAWKFTKKNWKEFVKRYPPSSHMLQHLIMPAASLSSKKDAEDFAAFFKKHAVIGTHRSVNQALETIRMNMAWIARDQKKVIDWLAEEMPGA